jgi:hypothetical protein
LKKLFVLPFAAALLGAVPASATITGISPTGGSTGTLVINNACTNEVDSGMIVTGCLNTDHNSDVNFYSNEALEFGGGGQAVVEAQDGLMSTLTINPVAFNLDELILNINASADGFAQFCDNGGCFGTLFALSGNGSNFFDMTFNPAADFMTLNTFSDGAGATSAQLIEDTKQWRVGIAPTQVPEPATWTLIVPFLIGGLFYLRRRKAGTTT